MVYLNKHFSGEHDSPFWIHKSWASHSIFPSSLNVKLENSPSNEYLILKFDYNIDEKEFDFIPFQCETRGDISILFYTEVPYVISKIYIPRDAISDNSEDVFQSIYNCIYDEILNIQHSHFNLDHLEFIIHSFDNYRECIINDIDLAIKKH